MMTLADLGPLKPILGGITALSSIAVVLIGGFKKRASWEPSSEDLPQMTQQIASIIISVAVAILFVEHSQFARRSTLEITAAILALASLVFGLSYVFAVGLLTYQIGEDSTHRVLGGLWRRKGVDEKLMADPQKLSDLLKSGSANFSPIWSRISRQSSKILIMMLYVMLLCAAGLALATAAIVLIQPPPDRPALGVTSISLVTPLQADIPVEIRVRGQNPATEVAVAYRIQHSSDAPASLPEPPDEAFTSSATVSPHAGFAIIVKSELTIAQQGIDAVQSGTSKLYVYGVIRYKDYQGNAYATHYCASYDAKTNDFPLCDTYNSAN